MSLSEGDKDTCREIARAIVSEVLLIHIQTCPHGRSLMKFTCVAIGIAIGSGIASGGLVLAVFKFLTP